jgi:hypothetical protein
MAIFNIEVKETLSRVIEVEAYSEDEALEIVKNQYKNEDVVLDYYDYINTEISLFI